MKVAIVGSNESVRGSLALALLAVDAVMVDQSAKNMVIEINAQRDFPSDNLGWLTSSPPFRTERMSIITPFDGDGVAAGKNIVASIEKMMTESETKILELDSQLQAFKPKSGPKP